MRRKERLHLCLSGAASAFHGGKYSIVNHDHKMYSLYWSWVFLLNIHIFIMIINITFIFVNITLHHIRHIFILFFMIIHKYLQSLNKCRETQIPGPDNLWYWVGLLNHRNMTWSILVESKNTVDNYDELSVNKTFYPWYFADMTFYMLCDVTVED